MEAVSACYGASIRTKWWTPALKEVINLKKEAYGAQLAGLAGRG